MKRRCKHKCGRKAAPGRRECNTCKHRHYKEKNRDVMAWHWIKKSAKRRGIPFTISKEYFCQFIKDSGYIKNSGRLAHQLTVDRKDGRKGYEEGNLCVITKSENSSKYHNKKLEYPTV